MQIVFVLEDVQQLQFLVHRNASTLLDPGLASSSILDRFAVSEAALSIVVVDDVLVLVHDAVVNDMVLLQLFHMHLLEVPRCLLVLVRGSEGVMP